ncbi:hypothetical protein EDB83DRAFT_2420844 [Lactarius deliciosus]|nr:hypothetical protein EDB83DRAFT_2448206 [Lactarius deliciosus]KAH9030264.1 hypothetical protein EDB83DRAFT_2420844 [Lactarius deliciosus]
MAGVQTLLVDGYVSQTFRSRAAEQYFLNLLRSTSVPPHTPLSYPGREGNFFFLHSVPSHIPAQHSSPPGRWLLDRGVVTRGTVVPQTLWSPHSAVERRQQVDLQLPIFFENTDGRLGISLEASVAGQCYSLRDASYPAQLGDRTTTNLRIAWPGYREFKRQIPVRDETSAHSPITTAALAHRIGQAVDAFLQGRELDHGSSDDRRESWRIGQGGIRRDDVVIIGAINDSTGSWMPIVQLNRYII